VAGRGRVEENVPVGCGGAFVSQKSGELLEGGDFHGAGARELLFHSPHGHLREDVAVRAHDPVAVGAGRRLGVDVERVQAGNAGDSRRIAESRTPRTSSRFDAGSVLTRRTCDPPSASATAPAHARDVFPTPPFPVKKRKRVGRSRKRRPGARTAGASVTATRSSSRSGARGGGSEGRSVSPGREQGWRIHALEPDHDVLPCGSISGRSPPSRRMISSRTSRNI